MFTAILNNLDKPDLGQGAGHTVQALSFLPANGTVLPFGTLDMGTFSGVSTAQNVVLKDKDALSRLWSELHKNSTPTAAMPDVDFAKSMVIGVLTGELPSGCQATRVTKVAVADDKVVVNYTARDSAPSGIFCIQGIASPYHLVVVERSDAKVDFADVTASKIHFSFLDSRDDSRIDTPQNLIVKDPSSWAVVWERHTGGKEKAPEIDFTQQMVIGVFLGQQTACYATEIVSIDASGGTLNVTRRDQVPGPATLCAAVVASRAQLVVLPRSDAPVVFATDTVKF
jgi:hypothetical protein